MVNYNGRLTPVLETEILPYNRGLHYGDAIFETIRVTAGKLFFWEDHYFRLMASMRIMRMEIPMSFTLEFLQQEIEKTMNGVEASGTCRIKLLVWRKWGGKYTPKSNDIEYAIFCEQLDSSFYTLIDDDYEIELFKDHYIAKGLLSTLKTTNKAIHVLGSIFAKENDYQNCLLLNEQKQVTEALNGNIFLIKDYKIKTPPILDGCLNGVVRKQLCSIINQSPDYLLEEASISPFELQRADELWITNTMVGILPVTKYRKKEFNNNTAKLFLGKLNAKARLSS